MGKNQNHMGIGASSSSSLIVLVLLVLVSLDVNLAWARLPSLGELKPLLPNFHKRYLNGYVYCHGCQEHVSMRQSPPIPIEGAKVEVICENSENKVSFYKEGVTDCFGLFNIELKQYQYPTKDHCIAKLLSSPDSTCNVISCFNNGDKGVTINKSNAHEAMGIVDHTVGPFAFTHDYCSQH